MQEGQITSVALQFFPGGTNIAHQICYHVFRPTNSTFDERITGVELWMFTLYALNVLQVVRAGLSELLQLFLLWYQEIMISSLL